MGKKFFTLTLISTILTSSMINFSPPTASAMDGYWTYDEIRALEDEIDAKAKASCGESYQCEMEYLYHQLELHDEDYRYYLAVQSKDRQLQVTSFNPNAGTITVFYRDKNFSSWRLTGEEVHDNPKGLYIAWFNDVTTSPFMELSPFGDDEVAPNYVLDITNGTVKEDTHVVFSHSVFDASSSNWLPSYQKVTLNVSKEELLNCTNHRLYLTIYTDGYYDDFGVIDYNEFYSDYHPGMEYQLMYDKTDFAPHWVPVMVESNTVETPDPSDEPNTPETTNPSEDTEQVSPEAASQETEKDTEEISTSVMRVLETAPIRDTLVSVIDSSKEESSNIKSIYSQSPNTSSTNPDSSDIKPSNADSSAQDLPVLPLSEQVEVPLAATPEKQAEFPWWIIVFIFSGIILILWWFIPSSRRKK